MRSPPIRASKKPAQEPDVSIVKMRDIRLDNRVFRIDAHYFGKAALTVERRIASGRWDTLGKLARSVESFGAYDLTNHFAYVDEGIPFLRCQNIRDGLVDFTDVLYVPCEAETLLAKSKVQPGMLLFTMSGSVGNAAVALPDWQYPINSNQDIAKVMPAPDVDPFYLASFFNSRVGRTQTDRLPVGSVQQHIFLWMIERIKIPRLERGLESRIAAAAVEACAQEKRALGEYARANTILMDCIGLRPLHGIGSRFYVRRAVEAFSAERLDAEFFDPQASKLIETLIQRSSPELSSMAEIRTGFPWRSEMFLQDRREAGEPFVRIRDCKPGYLEPRDLDKLEAVYANGLGQAKARAGDLVVGMDGLKWFYASLLTDACYVNQRVAYVHRNPGSPVSAEFVLTCINSEVGQRQMLRRMTIAHTVGHITLDDIRGLLIPNVTAQVHDSLTDAIRAGHAAKTASRTLLGAAKRAVEIAVEDSASAAAIFLDKIWP